MFGWALIGALSMSMCDNICLALEDTFQFDAPPRRFVGRIELPAAVQDR